MHCSVSYQQVLQHQQIKVSLAFLTAQGVAQNDSKQASASAQAHAPLHCSKLYLLQAVADVTVHPAAQGTAAPLAPTPPAATHQPTQPVLLQGAQQQLQGKSSAAAEPPLAYMQHISMYVRVSGVAGFCMCLHASGCIQWFMSCCMVRGVKRTLQACHGLTPPSPLLLLLLRCQGCLISPVHPGWCR